MKKMDREKIVALPKEDTLQPSTAMNIEKCYVIKSPCKQLMIPDNVSLPHFVWEEGVNNHPDKLALINGVTGKSYTYKDGNNNCKKLAIAIKRLGIQKGEVVAIFMPNCPEYVFCLLGIIGIGAITTTINPNHTKYEVSKQFNASNTKLVITIPRLTNVVKEAIGKIDCKVDIIILDEEVLNSNHDYPTYQWLIDQVSNNEVHEFQFQTDTWNDTVLLPYSSGTTGLPKGVMLSTKNLVSNIYQNFYMERDLISSNRQQMNSNPKQFACCPCFTFLA